MKQKEQLIKLRTLPHNQNLKELAREKRKAGNLAEVLLWKQLRCKQLNGLNFDRQRNIGNFVVDFICPAKNVVIEVDGGSHHDKKEHDKIRDTYLQELGLSNRRLTPLNSMSV